MSHAELQDGRRPRNSNCNIWRRPLICARRSRRRSRVYRAISCPRICTRRTKMCGEARPDDGQSRSVTTDSRCRLPRVVAHARMSRRRWLPRARTVGSCSAETRVALAERLEITARPASTASIVAIPAAVNLTEGRAAARAGAAVSRTSRGPEIPAWWVATSRTARDSAGRGRC
jgi:hypothetical protein